MNRVSKYLTLQIEKEIRLQAFCWFVIIIIFVSLVTVHFYRLLLNLTDTGFALFCSLAKEEILLFTIIIMMCPGVPDPRCDSSAK